jgi:hypothetical protein
VYWLSRRASTGVVVFDGSPQVFSEGNEVMEDDEKETTPPTPAPEAKPEPTPNPTPPPAPEPRNDNEGIKETVDKLSETVASLVETVSQIVTKSDPDTKPVKRPWTHWGSDH